MSGKSSRKKQKQGVLFILKRVDLFALSLKKAKDKNVDEYISAPASACFFPTTFSTRCNVSKYGRVWHYRKRCYVLRNVILNYFRSFNRWFFYFTFREKFHLSSRIRTGLSYSRRCSNQARPKDMCRSQFLASMSLPHHTSSTMPPPRPPCSTHVTLGPSVAAPQVSPWPRWGRKVFIGLENIPRVCTMN